MKHISVALNTEQLKSITKQAREDGEADYRFDLNLMEGKLSENKWAEVLRAVCLQSRVDATLGLPDCRPGF